MRKNIFLIIIVSLLTILLATTLVSSYGYQDDSFSSTSYSKTTTQGSRYGPTHTTSTNYDKSSETIYLGYGGYEKRTTYTKTTSRSPDYYSYPPRYTKRINYYGNNYGPYYPQSSYNYKSYNPSGYSSDYWRYKPSYTYQRYGLGNRYGFNYYYRPVTTSQGNYNWRY